MTDNPLKLYSHSLLLVGDQNDGQCCWSGNQQRRWTKAIKMMVNVVGQATNKGDGGRQRILPIY